MTVLPAALINQKNQLSDTGVWVILLQINLPAMDGYPDGYTFRLCLNTEDITWDGETWQAFSFIIEDISEESKNTVPQVVLRVSNVNRAVQYYVEKANGGAGATATIYIVHTGNLSETTVPTFNFSTGRCVLDSKWATWTIGAISPYAKRFPVDRILKNFCRYTQYGGTYCGIEDADIMYSAATEYIEGRIIKYTDDHYYQCSDDPPGAGYPPDTYPEYWTDLGTSFSCDRTFSQCCGIFGNNIVRFGGFPGVGIGAAIYK